MTFKGRPPAQQVQYSGAVVFWFYRFTYPGTKLLFKISQQHKETISNHLLLL